MLHAPLVDGLRMQPTRLAPMSAGDVGQGRKAARGGAGRKRSGLHGPPLSAAKAGSLDGRGQRPPASKPERVSRRLSVMLAATIVTRMGGDDRGGSGRPARERATRA